MYPEDPEKHRIARGWFEDAVKRWLHDFFNSINIEVPDYACVNLDRHGRTSYVVGKVDKDELWILGEFPCSKWSFPSPLPIELKGIAV